MDYKVHQSMDLPNALARLIFSTAFREQNTHEKVQVVRTVQNGLAKLTVEAAADANIGKICLIPLAKVYGTSCPTSWPELASTTVTALGEDFVLWPLPWTQTFQQQDRTGTAQNKTSLTTLVPFWIVGSTADPDKVNMEMQSVQIAVQIGRTSVKTKIPCLVNSKKVTEGEPLLALASKFADFARKRDLAQEAATSAPKRQKGATTAAKGRGKAAKGGGKGGGKSGNVVKGAGKSGIALKAKAKAK